MASLNEWFHATRPKTLAASVIPVLMASSIAYFDGYVNIGLSFVALICSLLIQIITNFINEIYDFKKGADNADRVGPKRMVASGVISPKLMRNATIGLVLLTFALGMILVTYAGAPILIVGILSLAFAYFYTGGPYPLAYKGLADIFVLIFFGLVAVNGTYYVLTNNYSIITFIFSFAPGLFSMNILGVNNIRDIETDRKVGKNTLALRLGRPQAINMYIFVNVFAFATNLIAFYMLQNVIMLLPLVVFPFSHKIIKELKENYGEKIERRISQNRRALNAPRNTNLAKFYNIKFLLFWIDESFIIVVISDRASTSSATTLSESRITRIKGLIGLEFNAPKSLFLAP